MDDIEKSVNDKALELISQKTKSVEEVNTIITNKVSETDSVKSAIDLLTTKTALQQEGVVDKLVGEKKQELVTDAETKKLQSETQKVHQEKEKILAEFDKDIQAKQKEVESLKAESDKAQAFFDSNKDILSYMGIRSKKTLKVMYSLMFPAVIIFLIVQIIALPITIVGKLIEIIINIVAGVCGAISNNALKIILGIVIVLLLAGSGFCVYYFGGKLIF